MPALDFTYEHDAHQYRNGAGTLRPSMTQALQAARIFDLSGVPTHVLERKRLIGNNVHECTAEHDLHGEIDPLWLLPAAAGYFRAWLQWRRDLRVHEFLEIERPMLSVIGGYQVGGTPDRIAVIGRRPYIVDLKCCLTRHPGWRLQTAGYEMMKTRQHDCGRMGRMSVRLMPDGRYDQDTYDDPTDAHATHAAVAIASLDPGDDRTRYARLVISAWKRNNRIKE